MYFRTENHVPLPGLYNLRDVGGYRTIDRRYVRRHQVWRADSPHRLDADGQAALAALGIRTIIDLRTHVEVARTPLQLAPDSGLRYRHRPLFADWAALLHPDEPPPDLIRYSELLLDRCQDALRGIMTAIANPATGPVLIHCTAGKDRTGLVVALLLALAGVPAATIVADYTVSYRYLTPLLAEMRGKVYSAAADPIAAEAILHSPPLVMWRTLEYLRLRYGGAAAYLAQIGVSEETCRRLQTLLIRDGTGPLLAADQSVSAMVSS